MKTRFAITSSIVAGLALASGASAAYTTVKPAPGSELGHAAILKNIYGGTFALNEGTVPTYTNGAVTLTRNTDSGVGGVLSIIASESGVADDQVWSGLGAGPVTVMAEAKYAGDSHTFGWVDGSSGSGTYTQLLKTDKFNTPVTVNLTSSFRWALKDTSTNTLWTSAIADNLDGKKVARDQMVTYRVTGSGITQPTFLLFWEDRIGDGADYDYNDAVIQLTACPIPAPGVGALGAIGAAGLLRRKRR